MVTKDKQTGPTFRKSTHKTHKQIGSKKGKEEYLCTAILADITLTKRSDMDHTVGINCKNCSYQCTYHIIQHRTVLMIRGNFSATSVIR